MEGEEGEEKGVKRGREGGREGGREVINNISESSGSF
jgi:hypothetical protein